MKNNLPIYQKQNEILQALNKTQCMVLSGNTGCGKSTQLPIIIHKNFKDSKILCTQPRRVACTNIARRVAQELNYQIGEQIGFHIGKQPQYKKDTAIIFITTGILMNYLIYEPQKLKTIDYLILDEVHERSIELDFIFLILKGTLHMHTHLKVILMSATLCKHQLEIFFGKQNYQKHNIEKRLINSKQINIKLKNQMDNHNSKASSVTIEQKMKYKISTFFIDTLKSFKGFKSELIDTYSSQRLHLKKALLVKEFLLISIELIQYILKLEGQNKLKPYGIFLIFLPGLTEIIYYKKTLLNLLDKLQYKNFDIIQMHSKLLQGQDINMFQKDKTNFIIATNIAESSITIPNVRYIIDFCLLKQQIFYNRKQILELGWSSKSSIMQRKGRTGRCNNGYFFAMVNSKFYKELNQYQDPDIQRVPLDKLILQINTIKNKLKEKKNQIKQKNMNFIFQIFKNPYNFFSLAIEKIPIEKINDSINYLLQNNAINKTQNQDEYENTFFGQLYQILPCSLQLAELIMYGKYLGCLEQTIISVSFIDSHKNILLSTKQMDEFQIENFYNMQNYYSQGQNCDYIIKINLFKAWCKQFKIFDWKSQKISQLKKNLINQAKQPQNQEWLNQNFVLHEGMIGVFEYYFLIKKNLLNTQKQFLQNSNNKVKFELNWHDRLKLCFLLTFFPTIAYIDSQNSSSYERDYLYLQQYLNLNAKNTLKIENKKFSQFLQVKNNLISTDKIDQARNIYTKKLQEYVMQKYGKDIKQCEFIGESCMVEFKEDIAIEKIRQILFIDKLQRKEQYSLKLFSFDTGIQTEDFELKTDLLNKKNFHYLDIGEFNAQEIQTIKLEQIEFAIKMIDLSYFDYSITYEVLTDKQIYIQQQSFNYTLIFPGIECKDNCLLISDSYKQSSKDKKLFRNTSLFHKFDNAFETILILKSNQKNWRFSSNETLQSIYYDHQDYDIKKWYQQQDYTTIKNLQQKIIFAFQNYQSQFEINFEKELIDILDKKRYSYVFEERWFHQFQDQYQSNQKIKKYGTQKIQEQLEEYFQYKTKILKQQQFIKELSELEHPQLICGLCNNFICLASKIQFKKQEFYRELKTNELRSNQKISRNQVSQYAIKNYQKQLQMFDNYQYAYFCPVDHLIALQVNDKIILPDFLNYNIQYSDTSIEQFDKFDYNFEDLTQKVSQTQSIKDQYLEKFDCEICYEDQEFKNFRELRRHFSSKDHIDEEKEFKKNLD